MKRVNFVVSSNGKIHIQNPIAYNTITLCRWCEIFKKSDKKEYNLNHCKICNKMYGDFKHFKFIVRDVWVKLRCL